MKARQMIRTVGMLAAAALSVAACADGERTLYTSDIPSQSVGIRYFRQPEGTQVSSWAMSQSSNYGGDVVLVHNCGNWVNAPVGYDYDFYSWTIAGTNVTTSTTFGPWSDGNGSISLGAGGLTMAANNIWRFGNKDGRVRIKLKESQTWSGPASGSKWAWMGIGCNQFYNGYYWKTRMTALKDLTWTLDGRLQVTLTYSNDLSNVDVVVNPLARLVLVKGWSDQTFGGKLGAKTLTLKGGDTESTKALFTVGASNPSTHFGDTTAPNEFDVATVAPVVNLVDGADITGGTVDYSVGQLNVTGGDSTFSGNVTLKDDVAIDIAEGATFAFMGTLAADEGAALTVTGAGRYLVPAAGLTVPVAGSGVLAFNPGAGNEIVLHDDLSAFTGTILALSGTVVVHEDAGLPEGATVASAEGASAFRFKASDAGDYTDPATGYQYYRAPDGVRHHYLFANKFTASTSGVQMTYRRNRDVAESVSWIDDSIMVFDTANAGGIGFGSDYRMYGFAVEQKWTGSPYMDGAGVLTFGAKGIHGDYGDANYGINFWKSGSRVKLAASQSWSGIDRKRSDTPLQINLGNNGDYNGTLQALEDDLTLTIEKDTILVIHWPTNGMANASLAVKYPALLRLKQYYKSGVRMHGRLGAKTLTIDGGDTVYIGNKDYNIGQNYVQSPTNVTADIYAKTIILKDGGVLTAKTLALWDDVALAATGSVNKLVGPFEFQNAATAVEVAEGATLDLATSATLTEKDGVSAALNVAGTGTLKIKAASYALTGGIALNGGTLEAAGAPAVNVSGAGTVNGDVTANRFTADAEATGSLAFNGTLTIGAAPAFALENLPAEIGGGVTVTLATATAFAGTDNLKNATFTGVPNMCHAKAKIKDGKLIVTVKPILGTVIMLR